MNVRFCPSCKSLILSDFRFCPYCGAPTKDGSGIDSALSGPFATIEAAQGLSDSDGQAGGAETGRGPARKAFAEVERQLERLEADMDMLIEELQKEGRSPK